ncbi:Hydroxyproline O-arabinosyltransferase RDN2 [Sesamum angolense]|uniref:Hydroxyproline O-arabinosyltransferase RDN2 n=1 Tax=Sesamum angolense TaxID=2727404 RepID=A0AAE1X9Z4_9LAMI|nr:Hydroxyproline O-arabinosyltransferase RDN2 [Sesamum angolense]
MHKGNRSDAGELHDPIVSRPDELRGGVGAKFHVALTATDAPYSKWQCRIMYYWKLHTSLTFYAMIHYQAYLVNVISAIEHLLPWNNDKTQEVLLQLTGNSVMSDNSVKLYCFEHLYVGYIVLNRPWAFVQWLEKATIEEEYILMAEPDHIFVNPLPNLAHGDHPAAFPFFYIKPAENEKIMRKYYPEEMSILEKIAPTWMNVSLRMKDDPETDKAFGWVLEMYGYAVASALHGVRIFSPPWDLEVGNKFIIHYTYGCDYNMKGELTYGKIGEWRFDKRSHLRGPPPRNLSLPPPGVPESVVRLVKAVNEASANIPNWDTQ